MIFKIIFFLLLIFGSVNAGPLAEEFFSLPRWRGFNLLAKFHKAWSNGPFLEEDFKMISSLGFNFVRLPMDYRVWCIDNNPEKINKDVLKDIDDAVNWAIKYNIHISLNFHRGPGYTVSDPPEPSSLWTDKKMQKLFIKHWCMFAKRYKKIKSSQLSFNLLNEPAGDTNVRKAYIEIVRKTVKAIRKIDPERFIIVDGFNYGTEYLEELEDLDIIQACRGYQPFQFTHYKASWVNGSSQWPQPVWPILGISSFIYGPLKKEFQTPLEIKGTFPKGTLVKINIYQVSTLSRLLIKADSNIIFDKTFLPKDGEGEWKKVIYEKQWNIYQNIYDREYETTIKTKATNLVFENIEGDWLTFSQIVILFPDGKNIVIKPDNSEWGKKQERFIIDGLSIKNLSGQNNGRDWLVTNVFKTWLDAYHRKNPVFIGEWGCYQYTPHDSVLRWMEDNLSLWKENNIGWALWNFRGSFGILDSGRDDVEYEKLNGHLLDRKMLDLLMRY